MKTRLAFISFLFVSVFLCCESGAQTPATHSNGLASLWQGEWAWSMDAADKKEGIDGGGSISIHDCKEDHCSLQLDSWVINSGCSVEGKIQLKSKSLASFDSAYSKDQQQCHFDLILENSQIGTDNESEGCKDSCGYRGADFGGGYEKYTDKHYYHPSFQCSKAKSSIELAICQDEQLSDLDKKLDDAFKTLQIKYETEEMKPKSQALIKSQRTWVTQRNKECGDVSDTKLCLQPLYEDRIKALNSL